MRVSLLVLGLVGLAAARVSYEGYKVYKVASKTQKDNQYLKNLEKSDEFDFWSDINNVGVPVAIMVPPRQQSRFEQNLKDANIEFWVHIENVERIIEAERKYHFGRYLKRDFQKFHQQLTGKHQDSPQFSFDQYYHHAEINEYLTDLASAHSDLVTLETIGQTYEKRDLKVVRIGSGSKPVIFVVGGLHARDWIGPAVSLYFTNYLIENSALLQDVDWVIAPLLNPDGYEYSWEVNRLWKKNRTPSPGGCAGVDEDRNFGFHWGEADASEHECDSTFAGTAAFSELETTAFGDYLNKTQNIKAYLTLQSYGQFLLYPWGYAADSPDNSAELDKLAHSIKDAIAAVGGTSYSVGQTAKVLFAGSGTSDDWAMGGIGVDLVFTFKFTGDYVVAPGQIIPLATETIEGFKVVADYVAKNKT